MLKKIKKAWNYLGPGFTTGASDDDPSGIATFAQTGALFGLGQLWLVFFTLPFMVILQEMSGRIGLITSKGIITNLKEQSYSKLNILTCLVLLLIANTFNIGANLGAMATSIQLFSNLPFWLLLIICTSITSILIIFLDFKTYTNYLKILAFSLLSYVMTALTLNLEWKAIFLHSIIPTFYFGKDFILNIIAVLGSVISPYIFFWQSNQIIESNNQKNKEHLQEKNKILQILKIDALSGMIFSNIIMWFIIITTATTLHLNGITEINSATDIAKALKPFAGNFAHILFSFGIISTGFLSIPILAASAAYAFSEFFNWKSGLDYKFNEAPEFYITIIIVTFTGTLINLINLDSIALLYYSAIINGITAPPLIFIVTSLANNKKIMGEHKNKNLTNILGHTAGILMTISIILLLIIKYYQ